MIDEFQKIINNTVIFAKHGINNNEWHIKENAKDSKIRKLVMHSIPDISMAFTLDYESKSTQYKQLSCYLEKTTKDINKGCDIVIVTESDSNNIIIDLIDLKSNKLKKSEIQKQLGNSEVFIKYLCNLIAYHYSNKNKVLFRKTIIFTGRKPTNKNVTYRGNMLSNIRDDIVFIPVKPIRGEVKMHFGRLANG